MIYDLMTSCLYSLQTHDSNVKLSIAQDTIIAKLMDTCSCELSTKFIAGGNLSCGDKTTDRVILQGALIGTLERSSAELHAHLQTWVDAAHTIEVTGIPLEVVPCSTYVGSGGVSCELTTPSPAPTMLTSTVLMSTMLTSTGREADPEESSSFGGIALYSAAAGGVAVVLFVILVIVLIVLGVRKKRKTRKYRTDVNRLVDNGGVCVEGGSGVGEWGGGVPVWANIPSLESLAGVCITVLYTELVLLLPDV